MNEDFQRKLMQNFRDAAADAMQDRLAGQYRGQAIRLFEITKLLPIPILGEALVDPDHPMPTHVTPPEGLFRTELSLNPVFFVVGIRLFHRPRDIVIDHVMRGGDGVNVVSGPVDAAAYAVETPLPPLERPVDQNYRGEAMRFVAADWGAIGREYPLTIYAKSWGVPSAPPRLQGYLVCQVEFPQMYSPFRHPLGNP